jgi:hypothetical protein
MTDPTGFVQRDVTKVGINLGFEKSGGVCNVGWDGVCLFFCRHDPRLEELFLMLHALRAILVCQEM